MNEQSTGIISRSMSAKALLGDVGRLYDLAREKEPSSRAKLAEEVSKLLVAGVTSRESELIADVLIELIEQAHKDLRCALSQKIAVFDNVPLRLVLQLANDEIDVAEPILKSSKALGELDLMYIIKSKTSEYWEIIAKRHNLSAQVVDLLADTQDFNTALALAENKGITLTDNALTILSDIAKGSDTLALPLLRREEVSAELARALYSFVGEEIKSFIQSNFTELAEVDEAVQVVDEVILDFVDSAEVEKPTVSKAPAGVAVISEFVPEDHMISAANAHKDKGLLNIPMMMETLRQNRLRSFVAMFSVYTDISVEMIGQVLSQTNGKSLSIICRAYGIEKQDFISIFMMTGKVWNNGQLVEMGQIKGALEYYNKMTRDMAERIVAEKIRI